MSGELTQKDGTVPTEGGEGPDKPTGKLGRRALMLGAATGVGAAAAVVAGASPAGAANGDAVLQGEVNTCSATTEVSTSAGSGLLGTINEDQTGLIGGLAAGVVGDVNGTQRSHRSVGSTRRRLRGVARPERDYRRNRRGVG